MKKIFLYKGRASAKKITDIFALVDDEDYEYLNKWKWGYMKLYHCDSDILYANRYEVINGKTTAILMHRVILGLTDRKDKCDHKDGNTLNNCKENLRKSTHSQNMSNRTKKNNSSSIYLGVYKNAKDNMWHMRIKHNGKVSRMSFKNEIDAAKAYNELALKLKGEFAKLNIIQ